MAITVSMPKRMGCYTLFLNISFLMGICAFMIVHFHSHEALVMSNNSSSDDNDEDDCKSLHHMGDYKAKCMYLRSNDPCDSQGYIDYLYLFYCKFGRFPLLGHSLLFLWLLVLLYLLANTTSEYFCSSLENLSKLLRLSPTIAGVTLLSLGNGACDVFSSLVSFQGSGTQSIGYNTVLGGVSFVTCVVVGIVSISIRHRRVQVIKSAFVRDVCFLLLVLLCLFIIFVTGEINVFGAIGFTLMYVVYVIVVYLSSTRWKEGYGGDVERNVNNISSYGNDLSLSVPLLSGMKKGPIDCVENGGQEYDLNINNNCCLMRSSICRMSLYVLNLPLYLPRRLTIPVVCEERWSKPYAVCSVILAPLLMSVIWTTNKEKSFFSSTNLIVYGIGLLVGVTFGVTAYFTTEMSMPPKKCLFPWLAGGFIMSVTWSYILAQELVGLLISIGYISGISPSILGLTVLAWGNSIGDLMTNLTMALNGGPEGAQIAISGCYAGPIFNTVVGLGLSLVTCTWSEYPQPVVIPRDPYLWETLAFLVVGLVWALVVLIRRDMKLNGLLGGGLLVVYFISLFLRLIQTQRSLQFYDFLGLNS
ncbi:cation/calcium exchanger 2-like [Gastrolobium bilobum]|uniref:cation/calcium exchanger 2-like n=1 Tax=Gastrolobium bilobum TaxID=150636 RepID=UPI002AB08ED8|nr:cation/calcium exchanger 2-like [Gastrolobium bilobum]